MSCLVPVCIVVGGVCEAIDVDVVVLGVVDLAHAGVQLVVGNAAPVRWFLVVYRLTNLQQRRRARPASVGVHVHAVRISSAVVTGAVSWRRSVWAVTVRTLKYGMIKHVRSILLVLFFIKDMRNFRNLSKYVFKAKAASIIFVL